MATRAGFNTKSPTVKRILQESKELSRHPDPSLTAHPLEENLFEWHFTIAGPPSSPYENGIYHGRIILPPSYPLRPPMFRFTTPSGRFETNREICLSISGHHEETWQPAWGIRTALCAIRAFMESNAAGQLGGIEADAVSRKRIAGESRGWRCAVCAQSNEDILKGCKEKWEEARAKGLVQEDGQNEVPEELRLAYKEELGAEKNDGGGPAPGILQEVPQQEGPAAPSISPASTSGPSSSPLQPRDETQSSPREVSTPQSSVASPAPAPTRTAALAQTVSTDDGIPAWIDKAIFGVAVSLVIMLLKRLLS